MHSRPATGDVRTRFGQGPSWSSQKALVPVLGICHIARVQIIARRTLREFWEKHPRAEMPLRTWFATVSRARWVGPADIRAAFGSVDFVADNRVIFDICGNKFRLIARVSYMYGRVLVKFVGTHAEYDRIDPEIV